MNENAGLDDHKETAKPNIWLNDFAKSVTSQDGEDGIVEKILSVIKNTNKSFLEGGPCDDFFGRMLWWFGSH